MTHPYDLKKYFANCAAYDAERAAELTAYRVFRDKLLSDDIEERCRIVYGPTWDMPTWLVPTGDMTKSPSEEMKKQWRESVSKKNFQHVVWEKRVPAWNQWVWYDGSN